MTNDDYKAELQLKKLEISTLLILIESGKKLMNDLASAADGAVLAGEPFPDELNERVRKWCQANRSAPIAEVLTPDKRHVESVMMHWAGIPVFVDGVVTTSPENWPLIDANDTQPKAA